MNYFLIPQIFFSRLFSEIPREGGKKPYNLAMRKLSALLRINILAGLKAANHGWLGASFSSVELLSVIYQEFIPNPLTPPQQRNSLILSKGHAVLAQYAILGALKAFPVERIIEYKALNGLPAHCDRETPGVDTDSGSLGQGLSKGIGLSLVNQHQKQPHKTFVILGDGELQEGQVFEAFLTLAAKKLTNCIPIIDRNCLQSDSSTRDIKDARNWKKVFSGIGLRVFTVNGHNPGEIRKTLKKALVSDKPSVIISETRKGFGTSLSEMSRKVEMRQGVWHGRVPDDTEYLTMISELVQDYGPHEPQKGTAEGMRSSKDAKNLGNDQPGPQKDARDSKNLDKDQYDLEVSFRIFRKKFAPKHPAKKAAPVGISTGSAFGDALINLGKKNKDFFVLDADLEKACKLTGFAGEFPERFVEIGISEQDMVSVAAGMGLGKKIGIVNTYASFYRRCFDQVYCASAEKLPLILAGHYSGLDYFTDGKTHQCLNDIGFMRSIGGVDVFEPLTPGETLEILSYLLKKMSHEIAEGKATRTAYLKLHRTPVSYDLKLPGKFRPGVPYVFESKSKQKPGLILIVSGPHMLCSALKIQEKLAGEKVSLMVVAVSSFFDSMGKLKDLMQTQVPVITLEDNLPTGGLGDFISSLGHGNPKRIAASGIGGSARNLQDMLDSRGLSENRIHLEVRKSIENAAILCELPPMAGIDDLGDPPQPGAPGGRALPKIPRRKEINRQGHRRKSSSDRNFKTRRELPSKP